MKVAEFHRNVNKNKEIRHRWKKGDVENKNNCNCFSLQI